MVTPNFSEAAQEDVPACCALNGNFEESTIAKSVPRFILITAFSVMTNDWFSSIQVQFGPLPK